MLGQHHPHLSTTARTTSLGAQDSDTEVGRESMHVLGLTLFPGLVSRCRYQRYCLEVTVSSAAVAVQADAHSPKSLHIDETDRVARP